MAPPNLTQPRGSVRVSVALDRHAASFDARSDGARKRTADGFGLENTFTSDLAPRRKRS
jgi:hypothetical protein